MSPAASKCMFGRFRLEQGNGRSRSRAACSRNGGATARNCFTCLKMGNSCPSQLRQTAPSPQTPLNPSFASKFLSQALRNSNDYSVSRDGQRFLINSIVMQPVRPSVTLILNWASGLLNERVSKEAVAGERLHLVSGTNRRPLKSWTVSISRCPPADAASSSAARAGRGAVRTPARSSAARVR